MRKTGKQFNENRKSLGLSIGHCWLRGSWNIQSTQVPVLAPPFQLPSKREQILGGSILLPILETWLQSSPDLAVDIWGVNQQNGRDLSASEINRFLN